MTWECRHLLRGQCMLRQCECVPGDKGCVLRGRYEFPLKPEIPKPRAKRKTTPRPPDHDPAST